MNIEDVREYCLSLPCTTEDMSFGDDILCLRVDGRIFAMLWLGWPDTHIALKCNPDTAVALREQYRAVKPAYHMNKRHWNDVYTGSDMGDETLKHCINHSYNEVVRKMPKYRQTALLLGAERELDGNDIKKM